MANTLQASFPGLACAPDRFKFAAALNAGDRDGFVLANGAKTAQSWSMQTIADACKSAVEQGIAEEEALKKGLEARSKELVEKGAEVYVKV